MSAERMMVNAMQEQPALLLPLFMLIYYIKYLTKSLVTAMATTTLTSRLPE